MFAYPLPKNAKRGTGARFAFALLGLAFAAPAHADGYQWTGFYAGLNGGGTWGSSSTDIGCNDPGATGTCLGGIAAGAFVTSASNSVDGFIGGGQVGYNFQTGYWLFGVETDISGSTAEGGTTDVTQSFVTTLSQDLDWLGTVRGRLGFVEGSRLLYATGGLAYGHAGYEFSRVHQPTGDYARASGSTTRVGWTAGGGFEYAFGHWTLKTEYLYYDLGSERLSAQLVDVSAGIARDIYFEPDFETNGHIVRAGVNIPVN